MKNKNAKKVIILFPILEEEFDIEKMFVQDIELRGYLVEIWGLNEICYAKDRLIGKKVESAYWNIRYISSKREFINLLHSNRGAYFIDFLGEMSTYPKVWIRYQMKREKCQFYFLYLNPVPVMSNLNKPCQSDNNSCKIKTSKRILIINKIKRLGLAGWIKDIWLERFCKSVLLKRLEGYMPTTIFLSTKKNMSSVPPIYTKAQIVLTHSWDYERLVYHNDDMMKEISIYKNCIVFIDEALTHHPDMRLSGNNLVDSECQIEKYYKDMCHFFDIIEKLYNFPVIIAAHPRSSYKGDEFGDRRIIQGHTLQLVSESSLVLISYSTAMSYVTLLRKPFILIDNYVFKNYASEYKRAFSYFFKAEFIYVEYIDEIEDIKKYEVNDTELMKRYVNNYVKEEESDNKPYWNIVMDSIEKGDSNKSILS